MRIVIPLAAALAVLVLSACGSGTAGSQASAHSIAPARSSAASSPAPSAPPVALPQWAGSTVYTDAQHYSWKLAWAFAPSPASDAASYTANDRPDQATLKIPVSGQIDITNLTNRNAVPPDEVDIFALYPARSPVCKYVYNNFLPTPPLVRFNGTPHPACPVLLMAGLQFGNATLATNASFSPQLAWTFYSGSGPAPFNVFMVPANREKAAIAYVNAVKPLAVVIAVSDAGSNPRQCSFASRNGGNTYVVDNYPRVSLTCVPGQAG